MRKRPKPKGGRYRDPIWWGQALAVAWLLGVAALAGQAACAKAPPTLSPVGVRAFHASRAVQVLDLVRDTAVAAEAATPQLLSTGTTRDVVAWHRAAVSAAAAVPSGWQAAALQGLDGLERNLPPAEKPVLAPYLALARAILQEVP